MRVLVTGIAGFIGSHLAERLIARGDHVVGLDNFDPFYARPIKEDNLAGIHAHAQVHEGDLLDAALVDRLLRDGKYDVIVHLAALAGVRPSIAQPARYQRVNVEGTAILADLCAKHGVPRIVFASSSSVYGDTTSVPFRESDRADAPVSCCSARCTWCTAWR
jgi:UDP-glucuronate 4-epimerase